ncbi:MAG: hypothetical protein ACJA1A_003102 [Saprospiraceae bacterium]|jgi:hypothetical protein
MCRNILFFILLFSFASAFSQRADKSPDEENFLNIGMKNLSFGYGMEFPFGDLADRYSRNLKFTLGGERITKNNWIYGIEFAFMFGDTVKEDPLAQLRLTNNEILGADNAYADVFQRERGAFLGVNIGKIISFSENSRSGLRVTGAIGILAHKIRIIDESRALPQIEGEYLKGYDRLTRGLAIREFIGYQHISEDKRINFYIGLEFTQGFTKHVRSIDFDSGLAPDPSTRFDGLVSLKAAWVLPFFDDYVDEQVFY